MSSFFIGRAWPAWPTHVRTTVGTKSEMEWFQAAFQEVMQAKPRTMRSRQSEDCE
jgi:histidinol-phosphate/aromatic aminotransferase/cobyric acid decarboxylase-like protein